jgi:hypothetical protein
MVTSFYNNSQPTVPANINNIQWRKLNDAELDSLKNEKQTISNCYDIATRQALLSSKKGRELLRDRVEVPVNTDLYHGCKVRFNIDGKEKTYLSGNRPELSTGELITESVDNMLKHNFTKKPLISRFARFWNSRTCEYNKPSNALEWYSGIEPISIGEGVFSSLKSSKEQTEKLLDELGNKNSKDYSFVILSGIKPTLCNDKHSLHCYSISGVDNKNKTLDLIEKRTNNKVNVSYNQVINNCKGITGIVFDEQ